MSYRQQLLLSSIAIVLSLLLFSCTSLDTVVQTLFYRSDTHTWLWPRSEPVLRLLIYDGIKILLIVMTLTLAILAAYPNAYPRVRGNRAGLLQVVLAMILVPTTVSLLKASTDIACPKNLQLFGGSLPYLDLISHWWYGAQYSTRQSCFPAGHASGGFALLSLQRLFDSRVGRRRMVLIALAIGWSMGLYKMAIGDHFLSHTVISMLLAWLIVSLLGEAEQLVNRIARRSRPAVTTINRAAALSPKTDSC